MRPNEDIRYVGTLQDYGDPFVALYVDVTSRLLYIMVRLDNDSDVPEYAVTNVEVMDVEAYMKDNKSLSEILSLKHFWRADFRAGHLYISDGPIEKLKESIDDVDEYIPEDCEDEFWIYTFLNRVKYNKPLVIGKSQKTMVPVDFIVSNDCNKVEL